MVELLTGGAGETPVHDAATVVLVRDTAAGLECLMLRKTKGQAFGGLWVFPGGRVEDGDGTGLDGARPAAVREAEEETGLVLDAADLVPFAHWNPPVEAPRRYATWFFLGGLPEGAADVVVDGGEIGDHVWTTPAAAHRAPPRRRDRPAAAHLGQPAAHRRPARRGDRAGRRRPRARSTTSRTHIADLDGVLVSLWEPDAAYESRRPRRPRPPPPPGHGPGRLALRALGLTDDRRPAAWHAPRVGGRRFACEHRPR